MYIDRATTVAQIVAGLGLSDEEIAGLLAIAHLSGEDVPTRVARADHLANNPAARADALASMNGFSARPRAHWVALIHQTSYQVTLGWLMGTA